MGMTSWCRYAVTGGAGVRTTLFLCPCHLSIYDEAGKVVDGPAPRALDVLRMEVNAAGDVKIIDVEYKAGVKNQIRLL